MPVALYPCHLLELSLIFFSHSNRQEVISHCGFNLIFQMAGDVELLSSPGDLFPLILPRAELGCVLPLSPRLAIGLGLPQIGVTHKHGAVG